MSFLLLSYPVSFYSTLNISFYVHVSYGDLFPRRFLNHHLYKYRYFPTLACDICSKLNKFIITIRFLFIHTFIVDRIFSPTYPLLRLFFEFQDEETVWSLLLFLLVLCLFQNLLSLSSIHNIYNQIQINDHKKK